MNRKRIALLLLLISSLFSVKASSPHYTKTTSAEARTANLLFALVEKNTIDSTALYTALAGYVTMKNEQHLKSERLAIIDFSKPSTAKRFYIINPETGQILYRSVVAHGRNSGQLYAKHFSNKEGSHQSSLGFYRVAEMYMGKHGKSLRLDGLEKGLNHLARQRAIVIHQADYAEPSFAEKMGYLGRSFGCPALPQAHYNQIVDELKNGTLLFIYHPSMLKTS